MAERILHKYASRVVGEPTEPAGLADTEEQEDFGAFGWLRGIRDRCPMLELRKKNGNILAVAYGWMDRMELNPSEGITLHAGGQKIRIKGRNLNAEVRPTVRLFEGLTRHRVSWVREASGAEVMEADETAAVVEAIEW